LAEHELDDNTTQGYDISTGNYASVNIDDMKKIKHTKNNDTQYLNIWNSSIKNHLKQSTSTSNPPDQSGVYITNPDLYESGYQSVTSKDVPSYDRSYFYPWDFSPAACAPTTATNLCMYYLGINYTKYSVLQNSQTGWTGTYSSLYTLMKTTGSSTSDYDIAAAYVSYFQSKGLNCSATLFSGTNSGANLEPEINNNRPCHLLIHDNNTYGNHSVLALGYKDYSYFDYVFLTTTHSIYIRIADDYSSRSANRFIWGRCSGTWKYVSVIPS
jgi:hypothetical protein